MVRKKIEFTKSKHFVGAKEITKVLRRIGKKLKSFERFEYGFINPIYFVTTEDNEEYVLRLTNPIWRRRKTLNEVTVMNFLRKKTKIPIPKIYDYDFDKKRIGFEYILMEKVEGRPLDELWWKYNDRQKKKLVHQIAGIFIQLKKFKFSKIGSFGKGMKVVGLVEPNDGPFDNFKDYMDSDIRYRIPLILKDKKFKKYVPNLKRFLEEVVGNYNRKMDFRLSHEDVFRNCLVKDEKITALIDFDWTKSAPNDQDFGEILFYLGDKLGGLFLKEVGKHGIKLPDGYEERSDMYRVARITTSLVAYKGWYIGREKEGVKFIKKEYKNLERVFERNLKE
jgi:aminoglycoside phosphotransferase (APT) family kinase protein